MSTRFVLTLTGMLVAMGALSPIYAQEAGAAGASEVARWSIITAGFALAFAAGLGALAQGLKNYLLHFAVPPGAPWFLFFIMLPIELISHLSRVMSLSLRLFGNVFGEELVIAILFMIIPWVVPLPMMLLGIITGGLQAFIFVLLTTIYLAGAVAVEHHDEHEGHDVEHDDRVDVGRGHVAATA